MDYKIDVLVICQNGKRFGVQCKSDSFDFDKFYKNKYIEGNIKAIEDGLVEDVVYVFNSHNGNIRKVNACLNHEIRLKSYSFVPVRFLSESIRFRDEECPIFPAKLKETA